MPLTPAQLITFKAAILAQTATIPASQPWTGTFAGTQVKNVPNTSDGNAAVAGWYNLAMAGPYLVWNPQVSIKTIRAAADIGKYTPTDAVPASGSTVQITNDAMVYQNRALACQLKQANAIFLLQGEGDVDASPQAFRLLFNDCMTAIPSGAAGVVQNAGWGTGAAPGAVKTAMQRAATNAEKVFSVVGASVGGTATASGNVLADARGGATNPDALVFVGAVSAGDVNSALNLP